MIGTTFLEKKGALVIVTCLQNELARKYRKRNASFSFDWHAIAVEHSISFTTHKLYQYLEILQCLMWQATFLCMQLPFLLKLLQNLNGTEFTLIQNNGKCPPIN